MDETADTVLVAQRVASTVLGVLSSLALLGAGVRGDQWALAWTAYGVVGALVLWHRPGNRIGWLCVGIGVLIAVSDVTQHLVIAPSTPAGVLVLQLANACGSLAFVGVVMLAAVFPTGTPSGRSGRLAVLIAGVMAVLAPLSTRWVDEVDAALAGDELKTVTQRVMAPTLVGLWTTEDAR